MAWRWRGVLQGRTAEASRRLVSTRPPCWLRSTSCASWQRRSRAGSVETLRGSGANERGCLDRACLAFSRLCTSVQGARVHAAVSGPCIEADKRRHACSYLLQDLPSVARRPYSGHAQQLSIESQRARHWAQPPRARDTDPARLDRRRLAPTERSRWVKNVRNDGHEISDRTRGCGPGVINEHGGSMPRACARFLPESNRHSHDDYLHAHDLILTCELQQVVRNPCDGARETIVEVVGAIAHGHALVVHDARVLAVRSVLLGTRPVPHLER